MLCSRACFSRTACHVPGRRLVFPDDVLFSRTTFYGFIKTCYVLFQSLSDVYPLLIPGIVFLSLNSSSLSPKSQLSLPEFIFQVRVLFQSLESTSNLSSSLPFQLRRLPFSKELLLFPSLSYTWSLSNTPYNMNIGTSRSPHEHCKMCIEARSFICEKQLPNGTRGPSDSILTYWINNNATDVFYETDTILLSMCAIYSTE